MGAAMVLRRHHKPTPAPDATATTTTDSGSVPEFTRRRNVTVANALAGDIQGLAKYSEAFVSAGLNEAELAEMMSADDIKSILPLDTPLADVLKLKRLFTHCFEKIPDLPAPDPWWAVPAMSVSTMTLDEETTAETYAHWDLSLLVCALMLDMSVTQIVVPTTRCADGSTCEALRFADILLWALTTAVVTLGMMTAFANMLVYRNVRPRHRAEWCRKNWGRVCAPLILALVALLTLPAALCTRAHIMLDMPAAAWTITGLMIAMQVYGQHYFAAVFVRTFVGLESKAVYMRYFAGIIGWWLPPIEGEASSRQ